jgi:hypothetical protein
VNAAIPVAGISNDFNYQQRPGPMTDMGALEHIPD